MTKIETYKAKKAVAERLARDVHLSLGRDGPQNDKHRARSAAAWVAWPRDKVEAFDAQRLANVAAKCGLECQHAEAEQDGVLGVLRSWCPDVAWSPWGFCLCWHDGPTAREVREAARIPAGWRLLRTVSNGTYWRLRK